MHISPNRKNNYHDRIMANQCEVCGFTPEELCQDKHRCYMAGHYCSRECYDTLFDYCEACGQKNMTVVTNEANGNGKLCDQCYMQKSGLSICTIVGRF